MGAIQLERFCFPVTLRCNLRCKLCAERSPYYAAPYAPGVESLTEQLKALFSSVEHIGKFDITGGEPFLYAGLPAVIQYLHRHCFEKIGVLRLTTNGTVLPPAGFADAAREWGGRFYAIVDSYPASKNSMAVGGFLRAEGIPHEIRDYAEDWHCNGWVDYGDLTLKHSKAAAQKLYRACAVPKLGFFTCMVNGRLFPCAKARLLYENAIANVSVNLFDPQLSENAKKERIAALLGGEAMEACRYCNGLCEGSPRHPPAEQLAPKTLLPPETPGRRWHQHSVYVFTRTYNNAPTIRRCIESVLAQTYTDFAYFIIDNGSADGTGAIISEYAARDHRVFHLRAEQNDLESIRLMEHVAYARANKRYGAYHCYLDGDDTFEPDWLEKAVPQALATGADIVCGGHKKIDAATGEALYTREIASDRVLAPQEIVGDFMTYRPLLLTLWGKLFSRRYKLTFDRCGYGIEFRQKYPVQYEQSDGVSMVFQCVRARKIAFLAGTYYNYYHSAASWVNTYSSTRLWGDASIYYFYKDLMTRHGVWNEENQKYLYVIFFSFMEQTLELLCRSDLPLERKFFDISTVFYHHITRELFAAAPDARFRNLARRGELLQSLKGWVFRQLGWQRYAGLVNDLVYEMDACQKKLAAEGEQT